MYHSIFGPITLNLMFQGCSGAFKLLPVCSVSMLFGGKGAAVEGVTNTEGIRFNVTTLIVPPCNYSPFLIKMQTSRVSMSPQKLSLFISKRE